MLHPPSPKLKCQLLGDITLPLINQQARFMFNACALLPWEPKRRLQRLGQISCLQRGDMARVVI